ncbi:hypothetical protein MBLNU230_g7291t1 [Neophaeotheca triangularis]
MAPKGKETLLELCNSSLKVGNSTAVHMLEYISEARNPRRGFSQLAIEFLEASRPLFAAKTGLAEAARAAKAFAADATNELREVLRQYNTNLVLLNQMVNRMLNDEHKQGFSKFARGIRLMFSDGDLEQMRRSLVQCRESSKTSTLLFTWMVREINVETGICIGYTALAAVLDRPDPTRGIPKGAPTSDTKAFAEETRELPQDPALAISGTICDPRRDLSPAGWPDSQGAPERERESWPDSVRTPNYSKGTVASQTFTSRTGMTNNTTLTSPSSESTKPSSISQVEGMMDHHVLEDLPKQAIRIKVDTSTVSRWRPKHTEGATSPGTQTALLAALRERNYKMVEHLLDSGASPQHASECSYLRVAIMNHDLNSVRLLLLFGADPNEKDKDNCTPLYAATEVLFYEAAQLLLKYGASTNRSAGPVQETPFALSLNHGKAHFALLYLQYNADPQRIMENGDTPFMKAINSTVPMQLVELMLVYEADPNEKNSHGETALFKAINANRLDLVTLLLDYSANPNLPGPKHMLWPAVHRPQILERLLQKGADLRRAPGCLELATSINSLEAVQILFKHGVDPNAKKDGIFTPLCTAIRDNREDLLNIIIAAGADANLPASEYPAFKCVTHHRAHLLPKVLAAGADPERPKGIIEAAVAHNNQDALVFLLKHGVDPNARGPEGHTALTTAIRKGDIGFIDILLSNGASPGVRGHEWPVNMAVKTPEILDRLLPHLSVSKIPKGALEMAVQANQLESVKLLLSKGVDVEEKNGGVFSPLTTSIREDRKAIFQFLLNEAGADPNLPGEHLPIIKAIRRHREDDMSYVRHLLEKGADINLMYRGWNAVLQALDKGDAQVLRLLADLGMPDLDARDEDGNSVAEIMQQRGMEEEQQILSPRGKTGGGIVRASNANRSLRDMVR